METTIMNAEPVASGRPLVLELFYRGKAVVVEISQTPYSLGRDIDVNLLCIESDYASRQHCVVEFRDGQFMLRDHSKNGTFVQLGRAHGFRLHNDTVPLSANGCFKLGQKLELDDPDLVHFKVKS
jgi:adenylate cyclase